MYIAHVREDTKEIQELKDHLSGVAELASSFCLEPPWANWARLGGLCHDLGKYSQEFQKRIRVNSGLEEGRAPKVDHATAGAQYVPKILGGGNEMEIVARLIGYLIAGHHGGLPDGDGAEESSLRSRLRKTVCEYESNMERVVLPATPRMSDLGVLTRNRNHGNDPYVNERGAFGLAFFVRYLYSCLVDADFLDTQAFMDPENFARRGGYASIRTLKERFDVRMEKLVREAIPSAVNEVRAHVLQECRAKALLEPGLFSLTVPTGGGKTLSSLAFALDHAAAHGLRRVIYVIPYTSIIEQNADVFRRFLNDNDEQIVEHHSSFEVDEEDEDDCHNQLAAENWDATVIVTTAVQFFESLFANRKSSCRKLHNMAESVIVLDEAQMIPPDHLRPCIEAIRELSGYYRATILLCTATQPAIGRDENLFPAGLDGVREIVDDRQVLYESLRRVVVKTLGTLSDDDLISEMRAHTQFLCVVSTRAAAQRLYGLLGPDADTFHLSGFMCGNHRTRTIAAIRQRLADGLPCKVISTSLVEAGVDVDFPVVFRAMAGIDSVAQAAGRCNREGKLSDCGTLYLYKTGRAPQFLREASQHGEAVVRQYGSECLSLDAVKEYFRQFIYLRQQSAQDDLLDRCGIIRKTAQSFTQALFPFRTIGQEFRLIPDFQIPVIVPYGETGRALVEELRECWVLSLALHRRLQRFQVQVTPRILQGLITAGAVEVVKEHYYVAWREEVYNEEFGLDLETAHANIEPEKLIV